MSVNSDYKKLFIIGCPRSGTTWVQLLLAQHPKVATAPETQIFAYYLDHFRRQWRHEQEGPGRERHGDSGLSRLLSEQDFLELCRRAAGLVLEKIAEKRPAAEIVAEKSPRHALEAEFIQRVFPEAYFLHVVRDPRDTAASLLAAARSWAAWAPKNAIRAARLWTTCVESARRVAGSERYLEIRYETLRSQGATELEKIASWLGTSWGRPEAEEAIKACEFSQMQKENKSADLMPASRSPAAFFRNGKVGGWRNELSRSDVRVVEQICAPLMKQYDYDRVTNGRRSLRIPLHDGIQRLREGVDWQLEKLVRSV